MDAGVHIGASPPGLDLWKTKSKVKCLYYVRSNPNKNNFIHLFKTFTIMKNSNSTISISVSTLNAIKNLLFSEKEGGVNLSSIVDDLTIGDENRDLVAINVGLTFKGIKPEIDTATRYKADYRSLCELTFVSYSMIRDVLTYEKRIIARWDSDKNDLVPCADNKESYNETTSLDDWYAQTTDRDEPTQELTKRWFKEPTPESAQ